MCANDIMGNGSVYQRKIDHIALCMLNCLADCLRYFTGLAKPTANLAVAIAHNHQCAEAEAAATLDNLGYAIDSNDFISKVRLLLALVYQDCSSLKLQALFAGAVSNSLDPAMIQKTVAVKNY